MENVIIQTAFLGDLVLAIPLMRQLTALDPDKELVVVCRQGLGELIRGLNVASEIIEVNKRDPQQWRQQRRTLINRPFHHIICPHGSPRTAALVWQMKASGLKVGFKKRWNRLIFNERVEKPDHLPDSLRQLALLVAISPRFAEEFSEVSEMPDVWNTHETQADVDFRGVGLPFWARLNPFDEPGAIRASDRSNVVFMAPGSTWPTKRWTKEGFIEVAKKVTEQGLKVILTGSPEERPLAEEIVRAVPGLENQAGRWSLSETLAAMREGRALIANDSGAIHLAALAGLPTVAIFGPTVLAQGFRPWQRHAIVVQQGLKCRPCGRHGHKKCPIGTHACMKDLPAERVWGAFRKLTGMK